MNWTPTTVAWLPWDATAFARARGEGKPILLSVDAPWSIGCREMDRVTYGDAETAAAINATCVAVRVDADLRPDLADRYDFGALPTTAFLTADGHVLGGGTFVAPSRLREALGRLSLTSAAVEALRPAPEVADGTDDMETLTDAVFATFDDQHAGFGSRPKFAHTAPVRLALDLYVESREPIMLERAARTLDAMGWGGLYDEEHGGFSRCAAEPNWSGVQAEKVLPVNAALLDLYVYAGTVASNERWFARAVDLVHFIERKLIAANGAWRFTESAEPGRQFSDANGVAASAMLHAARVFDDEALGKRAIEALERVLLASYKPGGGVAHSATGVRGLLTDHVGMATATLDAWESTGNVVYRMMAEELMHFAVRTMWDGDRGGFFDRAVEDNDPPGVPPCRPLKPFVLNCEAAIVLRRLAEALNESVFGKQAVEALAAVSGRAASHGPLAAHYLLARRAVLR
ncbi:MAG: DUF255 domain-containing protein [Acidobacteriota bacterium]|nr:DUF255 domain-containing protein [Acidobacteriota bacterium]